MVRYIIVGDVHGCLEELTALIDACDTKPDDIIVSVGDLVAKGTGNRMLVSWITRSPHFPPLSRTRFCWGYPVLYRS